MLIKFQMAVFIRKLFTTEIIAIACGLASGWCAIDCVTSLLHFLRVNNFLHFGVGKADSLSWYGCGQGSLRIRKAISWFKILSNRHRLSRRRDG